MCRRGVGQAGCSHGARVERRVAGECQLRGEEQFSVELPRIRSAVSAKLKEPITADRKFEDVVKSAQDAAVWFWCIEDC